MPDMKLVQKIHELTHSSATLLWMEGALCEPIVALRLWGIKLVVTLESNITRIVRIDQYAITKVGLQLWSQGHMYVIYHWQNVPNSLLQQTPEQTKDPSLKPSAYSTTVA